MKKKNRTPDLDQQPDDPANGATHANETAANMVDNEESLRLRTEERDQYLARLQRTQADFENYQKRNQRERLQEYQYRHKDLAKDLLPVLDNLERTLAAAEQANENGPLVQGVSMVLNQLLDILKRHEISPIEALGRPFDPNLHEAVMQQPSQELPPNSVALVLEKGFTIRDRVLRPARVAVSVAE
jgi:molecular chaperone GrpE